MTLKTFLAVDALQAALATAALPTPRRNDMTLTGFADSSRTGIGWTLAIADGGWDAGQMEMGEPPDYDLAPQADILFSVEGEPGPDRDAVLRDGMDAIAAALFPDGVGLAVDGVFDDLKLVGGVSIQNLGPGEKGEPPAVKVEFSLAFTLTAPTPFG